VNFAKITGGGPRQPAYEIKLMPPRVWRALAQIFYWLMVYVCEFWDYE